MEPLIPVLPSIALALWFGHALRSARQVAAARAAIAAADMEALAVEMGKLAHRVQHLEQHAERSEPDPVRRRRLGLGPIGSGA